MAPFRYAQLCPLARGSEIVGERWTLLIVRELLLGSWRFSDLRRRLTEVSTSVLAQRLEGMEERGLVRQRELAPPAGSTVYELTDLGRSLEPVLVELGRFGLQFMSDSRADDHFEPDWVRLALRTCARRDATPPLSFVIRLQVGETIYVQHVVGGEEGTRVREGVGPADATITLPAQALPGLLTGQLSVNQARQQGLAQIEGSRRAANRFPSLFEVIELPAGE